MIEPIMYLAIGFLISMLCGPHDRTAGGIIARCG